LLRYRLFGVDGLGLKRLDSRDVGDRREQHDRREHVGVLTWIVAGEHLRALDLRLDPPTSGLQSLS